MQVQQKCTVHRYRIFPISGETQRSASAAHVKCSSGWSAFSYLFDPLVQLEPVLLPIPGQEDDVAHEPRPADDRNVRQHLLHKNSAKDSIVVERIASLASQDNNRFCPTKKSLRGFEENRFVKAGNSIAMMSLDFFNIEYLLQNSSLGSC